MNCAGLSKRSSSSTAGVDQRRLGAQPLELLGVAQQGEHAVADQVDGRLVAAEHQRRAHRDHLELVERSPWCSARAAGGAPDRRRRWRGAPAGGCRSRRRSPAGRRPPGAAGVEAVHAAGDRARPLLELRALGVRDVEQLGDDVDRQRVGELGDQVDLAGQLGCAPARPSPRRCGRAATRSASSTRGPMARTRGLRLAVSMARTGIVLGRVGGDGAQRGAGHRGPLNFAAVERSLLSRSSSRKNATTSSWRKSTQLRSLSLQCTGSRGAQAPVLRIRIVDRGRGEGVESHGYLRTGTRCGIELFPTARQGALELFTRPWACATTRWVPSSSCPRKRGSTDHPRNLPAWMPAFAGITVAASP